MHEKAFVIQKYHRTPRKIYRTDSIINNNGDIDNDRIDNNNKSEYGSVCS